MAKRDIRGSLVESKVIRPISGILVPTNSGLRRNISVCRDVSCPTIRAIRHQDTSLFCIVDLYQYRL